MSLDPNDPRVVKAVGELNSALREVREMGTSVRDYLDWMVMVPPVNDNGLVIDRFTISKEEAAVSKLRAVLNRQRDDRSTEAGTYTRLTVDGKIWMTDTPAEIRDLFPVDRHMRLLQDEPLLIVGLGLGVVLNRALNAYNFQCIDVVESDQRVIDHVWPHYEAIMRRKGIEAHIWHADVHKWKAPRGWHWGLGFFDIWPEIDSDDLPEVSRLRNRFGRRLVHFEAWAQQERLRQKRRLASRKWAY